MRFVLQHSPKLDRKKLKINQANFYYSNIEHFDKAISESYIQRGCVAHERQSTVLKIQFREIKFVCQKFRSENLLNVLLRSSSAQKMKFSIKEIFSKCSPRKTVGLIIFTEEILTGKLHFLCSVIPFYQQNEKVFDQNITTHIKRF